MNDMQHEMYEYARMRIKKKKQLYFHFVLLFTGSILLFIINKLMHVGAPQSWYLYAIAAWGFLFTLHFIKVYVTDSFMNKKWERDQIDRLISKQEKKIEQLKIELENNSIN